MVGYSDKYESIGVFRVDRILKAPNILDDDAIEPPTGFDINHYLNTMIHMYDGDRSKVTLLCDNDVIDSIISYFGEEIEIKQKTEMTSVVTVEVVVSHIFFNWVFGFKGKVKIFGPSEIKESYISLIKNIYEQL